MERERVSEQQTMTDEYIKNIAGTRRIMSNVLNILSQQERTMRTIVTNEQRRQTRNNATNQIELDDFVRLLSPLVTPEPLVTPPRSVTPPPSVRTAPSVQEINYATREVSFSTLDNPMNNLCPISREPFGDDEIVMQIRPCGHIFSRDNLRVWFMSSVHCPMCRYDIRNYRTRTSQRRRNILPRADTTTNTNTNSSSQAMGRIASFITSDILRQLETTNGNDSSNNLLFEYTLVTPEIPDPRN